MSGCEAHCGKLDLWPQYKSAADTGSASIVQNQLNPLPSFLYKPSYALDYHFFLTSLSLTPPVRITFLSFSTTLPSLRLLGGFLIPHLAAAELLVHNYPEPSITCLPDSTLDPVTCSWLAQDPTQPTATGNGSH